MRNRLSALSVALSVVFAIAIANFARLSVQAMSKQIQVNVARAQTRAVTEATRVEADARVTVRATVVAVSEATFTAEQSPDPGQSIIPLSPAEPIPVTILPTPTAEPTTHITHPTLTAAFYADVFRALSEHAETVAPEATATPTPMAIPTPAPTEDFVDPTLAVILITPIYPTDTYEPTVTLTIEPTFTSTPPLPTDVPKPTETPAPTDPATAEPSATATGSPLTSPLAAPAPSTTPITTETPAP